MHLVGRVQHQSGVAERGEFNPSAFSQDISVVTGLFEGEIVAALRLTRLWITERAACLTAGQPIQVRFIWG